MSLIFVPNVFQDAPARVYASEWNNNFLAITTPLSGIVDNIEFKFIFNGSTPVLKLNQKGAGYIIKSFLNSVFKGGIKNNGQVESTLSTGTAPLVVASTTKVTNLNVDKFDNLAHSEILEIIGGTMTGFLTLHADPDANMKVSTKQYADSKAPLFMPSGTKLMFGTNPPAGWTRVDNAEDRIVRLSKAADTIGTAAGSWFFQGFTVSSYALTTADLPSHSHSLSYSEAGFSFAVPGSVPDIIFGGSTNVNVQNTGTGNAHSHGWNDLGTWRPRYEIWATSTKD